MIVVATALVSLSRTVVVGAFFIQQNKISQTLCENRDQPAKHCNGKCYLKKQLAKEEQKENHSLPFSVNEVLQDFIANDKSIESFYVFISDENVTHSSLYAFTYSHQYFFEIPHPPV